MAEGILGGVLGAEDDAPEESAEIEAIASGEAFAAALAMEHARGDAGVARAAERFLDRQAGLIELQRAQLMETHPFRLENLRDQSREDDLKRFGQTIRVGMQLVAGLVLAVVAFGFGLMIHDAVTSRTVLVEPFNAPPALTPTGVSDRVVAASVLDALQRLQEATRLATKAMPTETAWSRDVKIEVPETGVSIGEISRLLHERFGHDVHISGDLVQTPDGGLALTLRGDGITPKTFAGGAGDLEKLVTQAAEYAYGRSQSYPYAKYLVGKGRYDDALAFLPDAYVRASDAERPDLANTWGNAYAGQYRGHEAAERYRLALSLKPYNWKAWGNLVGVLLVAESEEAAWRESQAMRRAAEKAPKRDKPPLSNLTNNAMLSQDWPLQLAAALDDAKHNSGAGTSTTIDGPAIADIYSHLHDPAQAARYLTLSDPKDPTTKAETLLIAGYAALERGDARAAMAPLEAFWKLWLADPNLQYTYNNQPCFVGLAYGLAGRLADAEAVFRRAAPMAYCYALHGEVLAHAGDLAAAERVWSEGLRVGPDLSPVYLRRGLSELARGDLKRAEADLVAASARSPHWADPLKAWGDVLVRLGRPREALAKYDEALKHAPAWTALRQAREAATRRA